VSALRRRAARVRDRLVEQLSRQMIAALDERLGSRANTRPPVHDRLDDLDRLGRQALAGIGFDHADPHFRGRPDELPAHTAALLNWATGPDGPAAQRGLWFNPPVPVEHLSGDVGVLLVNERIVEQPFAFAHLARLPSGTRVLDVGGAESTVGLSLAALGLDVTVVDPREHPLGHPNLRHERRRLDELKPEAPFDAALALSSVEHFGLEGYDNTRADPRLDVDALRRLHDLVRPHGLLVLTVPYGERSVDAFQRVYDDAGLDELLAGWDVQERVTAGRLDRTTWQVGAPSREGHGVALVAARRPD
jgi:hypothetical protein